MGHIRHDVAHLSAMQLNSGVSPNDHVSDALATLHWLRLPQRVDFKVAVMAFRLLHGLAPPYLNDLVRVAELPGRRRLRSSSSHQLLVPPLSRSQPSVDAHFQSLHRSSAAHRHLTSNHPRRSLEARLPSTS